MGRPLLNKYQKFDGIRFYLKPGGYYKCDHKKGGHYMHRYVWSFYFGKIKEKMHIHHKDGNRANNKIKNLESISASEHAFFHGKNRKIKFPNLVKKHMALLQEKAKAWHRSREGREWHRIHAKNIASNAAIEQHKCIWCLKKYLVKRGGRKRGFCGYSCAQNHRYHSGIDNVTRQCLLCNKDFVCNKNNKTKFCGLICSGASRKKRQ